MVAIVAVALAAVVAVLLCWAVYSLRRVANRLRVVQRQNAQILARLQQTPSLEMPAHE